MTERRGNDFKDFYSFDHKVRSRKGAPNVINELKGKKIAPRGQNATKTQDLLWIIERTIDLSTHI